MTEYRDQERQSPASAPPSRSDPGNRTVPPSERWTRSIDGDGREVFKCTFNGCSYSREKRVNVSDHYRKSHHSNPYLCDKCDQRQQSLKDYRAHVKNTHTTNKTWKCKCLVSSYERLQHIERHEKLWCPERKNRPPGWEGREWDFEKKVFKPVKTTQQPPPSASSSIRFVPPEQRDSFVSPPQLPQHPFAPGNYQYNRNDVCAAQLGGQGYQPNPFDSAPFSVQHLSQNSPFSPLHTTPYNADHSSPPHPDYTSLPNPHAHNIPQTTALIQPQSFASSNSPYLFPNLTFNSYGLVPRPSMEQYYSSPPSQELPTSPNQTARRGSSRRGATSNIGRLPHSSPRHPYLRARHSPQAPHVLVHPNLPENPSSTETPSPVEPSDEFFDFDAFTNNSNHSSHSTRLDHSLRKLRLTQRQALRYGQDFVL